MRHKKVSFEELFANGDDRLDIEIPASEKAALFSLIKELGEVSRLLSQGLTVVAKTVPPSAPLDLRISRFEAAYLASAIRYVYEHYFLGTSKQMLVVSLVKRIKSALLEARNTAAFNFLGGDND